MPIDLYGIYLLWEHSPDKRYGLQMVNKKSTQIERIVLHHDMHVATSISSPTTVTAHASQCMYHKKLRGIK